jgi:hypothetical protein
MLPSSDPEVLILMGYAITRDLSKRIVVPCLVNPHDYHDAILRTKEVTFELEHEPTDEELDAFRDLETRIPAWAAALAEKLVGLTGSYPSAIGK